MYMKGRYLIADRKGYVESAGSGQDHLVEWLYTRRAGRMLLRLMVVPAVSKAGGWLLDSRISKLAIDPFIRSHHIDLSQYEDKSYQSYNDFFKRRLVPGARKIDERPEIFVSPCDSKVSVYAIDDDLRFTVKHTAYTVESLTRSKKLARMYRGGYVWVFRLCVEDYHHYIYVDRGREMKRRRIRGVFHTVNPIANDHVPIYKENAREYALMQTENFGTVLQMEVGALFVGKIENRPATNRVERGQEKGNFAFGGSTVILMTQAGRVCPDRDILHHSALKIETKVRLGERVGKRI